jgi:hypothetical protein
MHLLMSNEKSFLFHNTVYYVAVFLIVVTASGISPLVGIGSNQPQITMAQQQQHQLLEGISFQIDNVTFSHHLASFNGIQMHYVIGGQGGDPVVLLHGWPQSWYK